MQWCFEVSIKSRQGFLNATENVKNLMSTGNPDFVGGAAYNPSGGYVPSFHKKEVGSAGQRIQLAPLGPSVSGKKHPFNIHI